MNTPHTPEPWRKKIIPAYCSTSMMYYFTININDQPRIKVYDKVAIQASARANQIVACVNACAGMTDPAKEIAELRRTKKAIEPYDANELTGGYEILLRERDELRAEIARLKTPPSAPTCDEVDFDSRS